MRLIDKVSRVLLAPPASGRKALLFAIVLIAAPTGIRWLIDDIVGRGFPFFTYMPFIILAGAFLTWRNATLVSAISWIVADLLFMRPQFDLTFNVIQVIGMCIFATSAFLVIALVEAVRTIVENSLRPARPDSSFSAPVVFSLEGGQAWASWYGSHSWVRLGPEDEVAEMMRDFLAQRELADRLTSAAAKTLK
ncbi:DUF4118 domain-containing protein [Sphingomonas sp. HDW15A]|uniref:DUF4118 domain-containing protein n=1 Tax=Sphingomonas sp. HDW15A TaxID=2714942 RepID=UPI0014082964|nr:DUF4118 domain-containing protein [Sphingomonas sp. HDW15A]QIK95970.1 DUF4118 domain-containing protein [Sphingomonas sp. HDW15A]